jgi:protein farnesyltransferase subunit beta
LFVFIIDDNMGCDLPSRRLSSELVEGVAEYILRCQTYEGGFGGEPGNEAHGGYNFCALAGLLILGQGSRCDLDAQEHWLLRRQVIELLICLIRM